MTTKKKKKRKLKKGIIIPLIILSSLLIIGMALWAVIKFVPNINILTVKKISVTGDAVYNHEIITEVSEIKEGISILKLSFGKIEGKLESELPYIKEAKISYSLNGELIINIVADQAVYSVKSIGKYYIFNSDFKLLEIIANKPKGILLLHGVSILPEAEIGKISIDEETAEIQSILKIEDFLKANKLTVDVIDLSDKNDIKLIYLNRFVVELGGENLMEDKIKMFSQISKDLTEDETGRILLKFWTDEDRRGSVINENIDNYLNIY